MKKAIEAVKKFFTDMNRAYNEAAPYINSQFYGNYAMQYICM